MYNKLKTSFDKKIIQNIFSLSLVQIINYATPVLSFPYLIKKLGVENYGIITTALSLSLFFSSIVDFGFELTGVKAISQNKGNFKEINRIFSSIALVKMTIALILIIFYYIIVINIVDYNSHRDVFLPCIGIFLSRVLIVNWFFQGIEKMKFITITNTISNVIYLLGIFTFVRSEMDIHLVTIYRGLGFLISGVASFIIAFYYYNVKIKFDLLSTSHYIKESFFVFVSILSSSLLQNGPVIIISNTFNFEITGYYSSIEKIISLGKQIIMTVNQVFFPRLSIKYKESFLSYINLWKKVSILSIALGFLVAFSLVLFQKYIFAFLFENTPDLEEIDSLYFVLLTLLITYAIINSLGLNALLIFGKNVQLAFSQIIPASVFIIIIYLFRHKLNSVLSIALGLVLVDVGIIIIRLILLNRIKKFKILKL